MATATFIQFCTCGHQQPSHVDNTGACKEPTNRCECTTYVELCPRCRHAQPDHNSELLQCTRIVKSKQAPCGCTHYMTSTTTP